ncbi:MAG: fibrillarin-like rRNA/tRNA 2'-O-methyltransferase, partial [Candidatus Woesearchaeota archaeon]
LCSYLTKGGTQFPFQDGSVVLYLGASTGTTVSHVSDIVGKNGIVFALDFAPRVLSDLVFLAEERSNIAPILADAGDVMNFADKVCQADIVFQDVAQKNQLEIFLRNVDLFLKQGGFGYVAIKARSVDVTKKPNIIFDMVKRQIKENKSLELVDSRILDPFQKDHCMFVVKKR